MVRIALFSDTIAAACFIGLAYIDNEYVWFLIYFYRVLFLSVGFFGRSLQGIATGLLQTAGKIKRALIMIAYSELIIQFPEIQE